MAQAVILLRLDHLPVLGGIVAETARIELAHRYVGGAMNHPAGQLAGQARAPADADLGAAAAPVIGDARRRTDQRVAVWRMRDRAMHLALDAQLGEDRHAVQRILEPRHDPVVIRLEQLVLGLPRAVVDPDGVRVFLLVDSDQAGFLFHPDVAGDELVVPDHRKIVVILEFRHRVSDEIMVGHRGHGKLQAAPLAHLPRIGAAGIDHMLAKDVAFFGLDQPFAARLLGDVGGPAAADDPRALGPCSGSKRLGDAGRVGMAVFRRVERALHAFQIVERVVAADFLRPDELDRKAEGAADTHRVAQPVDLVIGIGKAERPAAVPGDGHARFLFETAGVEADIVIDAFAEAVAGGGVRDLPGGMPGRTRGQLSLLEKHDVAPALMCQMIGEAASHDPAADNHHPCGGGKLACRHLLCIFPVVAWTRISTPRAGACKNTHRMRETGRKDYLRQDFSCFGPPVSHRLRGKPSLR